MTIPENCAPYRRTPDFTHATLPPGLRRAHATAEGVWAKIHVERGRLRYVIEDPPSEDILEPGRTGIIAPRVPHHVEPLGEVLFHLEFWRAERAG